MTHSSFTKVVFVLALVATIIGFTAFSQEPGKNDSFRKDRPSKNSDTSKLTKRYRNDASRNFDQLDVQLDHLDLQMKHLDEQMKHLDEQLQHMDFSNVQKEVDLALKDVDPGKITAEVDEALKKVDWKGMDRKMQKRFEEERKVHLAEAKKQVENAKVQMEEQKRTMRMAIPKIDTKKIRIQTEEAMKNARKSIEKAKEELQNMGGFTKELEADGLIDKSKSYKIEVKEGELYINGTKQSKETSEKYRRYYKKDNFTINMNGDKDRI